MGAVEKEIRLNVSMTSVSPAALTSVPKEKFPLFFCDKKVCWLAALNASYKFAQPASKLFFFWRGQKFVRTPPARCERHPAQIQKHPSGLSGETVTDDAGSEAKLVTW